MQDLENDIDDLFRKAVNNNPAKPPPNGWKEVTARIESTADSTGGFFGRFQYAKKIILRYFAVLILTILVISTILLLNKNLGLKSDAS
jgi:hypothetical protein